MAPTRGQSGRITGGDRTASAASAVILGYSSGTFASRQRGRVGQSTVSAVGLVGTASFVERLDLEHDGLPCNTDCTVLPCNGDGVFPSHRRARWAVGSRCLDLDLEHDGRRDSGVGGRVRAVDSRSLMWFSTDSTSRSVGQSASLSWGNWLERSTNVGGGRVDRDGVDRQYFRTASRVGQSVGLRIESAGDCLGGGRDRADLRYG